MNTGFSDLELEQFAQRRAREQATREAIRTYPAGIRLVGGTIATLAVAWCTGLIPLLLLR